MIKTEDILLLCNSVLRLIRVISTATWYRPLKYLISTCMKDVVRWL